ncbi:hypothetical protein RchiOBHm_Chr2g0089921 [Rosa chinensis]|uniref:Uncharacterized protein n=1 Tax=Rosa chinensis TaxID=74649 RepID=A0A2P6RJE6_ROSCH|nr:hypothetical protein RchiOBHm_Chr2g0089921 [Rosa chinensis]
MRWEENKPVGSLLPSCVEVSDHVAILPAVGSGLDEDKDYQNKFREAVEAFLGFSGTHHHDRDNFFRRLRTPLSRERFAALYFHRLLLNEAQRADFPADTVENLRNSVVCYSVKIQGQNMIFWKTRIAVH